MTPRMKGVAVLVAQVLLVSSVAAKYGWERHACPRVWTRATQFDPQMPLRGRYLALSLEASACGLGRGAAARYYHRNAAQELASGPATEWRVVTVARDGKLAGREAPEETVVHTQTLTMPQGAPCDRALLTEATEFFLPERASTPFPLPPAEELWAEVTVPGSGPPRPIRLAVSDGKSFRILELR